MRRERGDRRWLRDAGLSGPHLNDDYVHHWEYEGRVITMAWVGDEDVPVSRAYALAFDPDGRMLLVGGPPVPGCWLPGGGMEPGETEEEALRREFLEEAGATIMDLVRLGAQRSEAPGRGVDHQSFYWCRITMPDDFVPQHEVTECHLVRPDEFLDTLFWGRTDPKAAMLLERALEIESSR
jgi:8-oxo-dGTP pyrophosphatase MutT (NUDIX family)